MKKYVLAIWLLSVSAAVVAQNPGDLNQGFGNNGHQVYDLTNSINDDAVAIDVQSDGKIIVVSEQLDNGNRDVIISRMNPDGSMDNSFDFDGKRSIDINSSDQVYGVKVLSNGKIVAVGATNNANDGWNGYAVLLNSDGSLDNNFGTQGILERDESAGEDDIWTDVEEMPNGSFVIGGTLTVNGKLYFSVRSLTVAGQDNPAWSSSLKFMEIPNASNGITTGIDVDSNGDIIVGGYALVGGAYKNVMTAFTSTGTVNYNFFSTGIRVFHIVANELNAVLDIKYDKNDDIVAVGVVGTAPSYDMLLMRLGSDGYMDTTFSQDGWVQSDLSIGGSDEMLSLHILPDNRILVSGRVVGAETDVMTAVMLPNGTLDQSWGNNGVVITDFGYTEHEMMASAVRNGMLYVLGNVQGNTSDDIIVGSYYAYSTVGQSEFEVTQSLIYPNPATDVLNVELGDADLHTIEVLDLSGRIQLSQPISEQTGTIQLDLTNLPNGVYLLQVKGDHELRTNRFVIH